MDAKQLTDVMMQLEAEKIKNQEQQDPLLVFVSEQGEHCCARCRENHGKRYRTSDTSRPQLPLHPHCQCHYQPIMPSQTLKRTAVFQVAGATPLPFSSIKSADDMLDQLEAKYPPGALKELAIINHNDPNGTPGHFELGSPSSRLENLTEKQKARLKMLLAPDAVIDIRMCYSASNDYQKSAQSVADQLDCKVRGYKYQVSSLGGRPPFAVNHELSFVEAIKAGPGVTMFYPQKKRKED